VLDELCVALFMRIINKEDAWRLIDEALKYGDVVATGRYAPEALKERADYVSNIQAVKHPFNEGIPARQGIEW
jgi:cob(I)alamin adenosyltransferase